jgi:phosphatidylserine decarboxylase
MEIRYWDQKNACMQTEAIFGEGAIRWLYETQAGLALTKGVLSRRLFSTAYGALQNSRMSARKIPKFIRDFEVPMEEFEGTEFKSFNEFFIRKFKPGKREFAAHPSTMPAFAEGRYLAYSSLSEDSRFPIKGMRLTASELLSSPDKARRFVGGPAFIARLCPVDYHRYHYPCAGTTVDHYSIEGALHSVNPIALGAKPDIFITNERRVALLDTRDFGQLAYVEVGALCVGKIVQTHDESAPFARGQEKGYFLFGGSSIVLLGEPSKWKPSQELLERTAAGTETLIQLGSPVAAR